MSSRIDNLADTMRSTQSLSNRGMEEFSIGANLESSLLWDRQIYIMELENQLKAAKVRASSLNTELAEFRDAAEQQSKQMAAFRGRISELEEIVAKNTVSESTLRRELEKEAGEAQAAYRRRILEVEEALANTSAFDTKHRTQRAELEKEVLEAKGSQRRIAELEEELLQLKVTLKRPNGQEVVPAAPIEIKQPSSVVVSGGARRAALAAAEERIKQLEKENEQLKEQRLQPWKWKDRPTTLDPAEEAISSGTFSRS